MADKANDPSTPSLAHARLAPCWQRIRAILDGAATIRAAGEKYLPKFPAESNEEYQRRKESAPWRPEFEDCVRGISARPFSEETKLAGEPSDAIKALAEDIDGRGSNIHVFARDMFEGGVTLGSHGILVEFPVMTPNATLAMEKATGARPYWVSVGADEIIAMRTERRGAREVVVHLRLKETVTIANGFEEKTEDRIRVIEPGRWEVWKPTRNQAGQTEWAVEKSGLMTLDEVPFVFFATADRKGAQYVRPPLIDIAECQLELYRFMSSEEQIYTIAGSPMLTANGMAAPDDGSAVETGPGRVLFAPSAEGGATSWAYIQPDAENLKTISAKAASIVEDMRRLGMQPLLPRTGNVTATASGIEAAKSHSAVGTWANALKDSLEQAFVFTVKWMKLDEAVSVSVHTDFSVGMWGVEEIRELREARAARDITHRTYLDELARRGVIGPAVDIDEEVRARTELEPDFGFADDPVT